MKERAAASLLLEEEDVGRAQLGQVGHHFAHRPGVAERFFPDPVRPAG